MHRNHQRVSAGGTIALLLILLTAIALENGLVYNPQWYKLLLLTIPLLLAFFLINRKQKNNQ